MKSIIWLASYPKSGNTWLRVFLANYLLGTREPLPLAKLHRIARGDALRGAYQALARGPLDPQDEAAVLRLRAPVLKAMTADGADVHLIKTHNRNAAVHGVELIPASLTRMALYVVRNPLDMVLSYADHYGLSLRDAATAIGAPTNQIVPDPTNVAQYLGSWSDHVAGWTRTSKFPVCTLRYEDMLADPATAFGEALRRMGVPVDAERLDRAIGFSSFDQLRGQENEAGFIERSRHARRFFRSGTAGQWRDKLPADIVETIRARHGKVMQRFGYLDP